MARIFSWHIKNDTKECFSYLAKSGTTGNWGTGFSVFDSKITNESVLNKIADVVSSYSMSTYQTQFELMKNAVTAKGLSAAWENWDYYYNVPGNTLVMLTGEGTKGDKGDDGQTGPKGDTGSAGKGRNIMCYCGLPSGYTPTMENVSPFGPV